MKFLVIFSTLLATSFAFAKGGDRGWVATPYLGYNSGTISTKSTGGSTSAGTFTDIPVGITLGYSFGGFWLAADATYGASGTTVTTSPSGQPNQTYTRAGLGADIGFKFGRNNIYLNYVASNTLTIPAQNNAASATVTGTAYGLNYLFEINNHFSIGANYYINTPTQSVSSGVTTQFSSVYSTYTSSNFGVLLAFPLVD